MNQTINKKRVIRARFLTELFTWVDASFALHVDMRSQTGGCMSFGWGDNHYPVSKQKLNTILSTTSNIIGPSEYYPWNMYLVLFMEELRYYVRSNIFYQDKQSAIKIEKNDKASTTGNSRYVHIQYFSLKFCVEEGEAKIQYCATHGILADCFTKPLQKALITIYWNLIRPSTHNILEKEH